MQTHLIILLTLFVIPSFGSAQDSLELSNRFEKKGWQHYFQEDCMNAKINFEKAIEYDSLNQLARVGWFNSLDLEDYRNVKDPEAFLVFDATDSDSMQWMTIGEIALKLMFDKQMKKSFETEMDSVALEYLDQENKLF